MLNDNTMTNANHSQLHLEHSAAGPLSASDGAQIRLGDPEPALDEVVEGDLAWPAKQQE
jgi:hypothetical protein